MFTDDSFCDNYVRFDAIIKIHLLGSLSLTADHIRILWVVLAGLQQMNSIRAVRIIRFSDGTFWLTRRHLSSNCQKTFTPLTFTGFPKLSVARNRIRQRYSSLPAAMVCFYFPQKKTLMSAFKVQMSVLKKNKKNQISKCLFSGYIRFVHTEYRCRVMAGDVRSQTNGSVRLQKHTHKLKQQFGLEPRVVKSLLRYSLL